MAFSFGEGFIQPGDEIIVSELEHHSNFVPWQLMCERKGAVLKVIPFDDNGELRMDVYAQLLTEKTRLVAVNYVSNSLGTINPVREIITKAHDAGAVVLIDGAQSVQHIPTDVQALDCEFFCFSGHKIYGPTGMGVLYGKEEWLDMLPPYQAGGEMISQVTIEKTTFSELPFKFEAGTPNIAGIIALGEALSYVGLGWPAGYLRARKRTAPVRHREDDHHRRSAHLRHRTAQDQRNFLLSGWHPPL